MRTSLVLALLTCFIPAVAAAATRTPTASWGKAGVSYQTYRAEAAECSAKGYFRDVSGTDAAQAFVDASKRYDNRLESTRPASVDQGIQLARELAGIVEGARPEKNMRVVGDLLQSTVDRCLVEHGYTRFVLTAAQRRDLAKLKIGSPERRAYLHKLARDRLSSPRRPLRQPGRNKPSRDERRQA